MGTRITATELARNLSDILNRVRYRSESFRVERNGETVAVIEPPSKDRTRFTVADLANVLRKAPPPDDKFADDLEAIHNLQGTLPPSPWES